MADAATEDLPAYRHRHTLDPASTRLERALPPAPLVRDLACAGSRAGHRSPGQRTGRTGNRTEVTPEELRILRLIAAGLPLYSVAQQMRMSPRTIRRRIRGLCDRLGLVHPIQAIVWAARRGLI